MMYGVIKLQAPFDGLRALNEQSEICLSKAILIQAIIDASNKANSNDAKISELDAKEWIFGCSVDLDDICNLANMSLPTILQIIQEVIKLQQCE